MDKSKFYANTEEFSEEFKQRVLSLYKEYMTLHWEYTQKFGHYPNHDNPIRLLIEEDGYGRERVSWVSTTIDPRKEGIKGRGNSIYPGYELSF